MSELVNGAIAEVEAFDKQGPPLGGEAGSGPAGSAEVPVKVQLGRTAQANLQVSLYLQLSSLPCFSQVDSMQGSQHVNCQQLGGTSSRDSTDMSVLTGIAEQWRCL